MGARGLVAEARRRWPARADGALATALFGLGLIELVATHQRAGSVPTVAVMTLPVAFCRRAALASAAVVSSWWLVDRAVGGEFDRPFLTLLAVMFVAYTLAAHEPAGRAAAGIALLLASLASDVL